MRCYLAIFALQALAEIVTAGAIYDNPYGVTLYSTRTSYKEMQTASPDEVDGRRLNEPDDSDERQQRRPAEVDDRRVREGTGKDERRLGEESEHAQHESAGEDDERSLASYRLNNSEAMQELEERVNEEKFDPEELGKIKTKLRDAHIIPDVLSDTFVSEFPVAVRYSDREVMMGQVLSINETREEPTVEFDAPPNEVFAVAIVDPDAPATTRHGYRSYRHFLVANLDSSPDRPINIITSYQGPLPAFNSGFHRYAVVVLKQKGPFNVTMDDVPESRVRFDMEQWGKERGMKPVAATYFMVKRNHVNDELD